MKFLLAIASCVMLANCGSNITLVSLDYQAKLGLDNAGPRMLSVGNVVDLRREGEFTLGTVRSPVGIAIEHIDTRVPVESVVSNAFAHGLKSRGMLAADNSSAYILSAEVLEFRCGHMLYPSASAQVRVNIIRRGSGEIVFSRIYQAEHRGADSAPGSGSSVSTLVELSSRTLQQVIDQALDDRELRRTLKTAPGADSPR